MLPDHPRTLVLAAALSLIPVACLVGVAPHLDSAALAFALAVLAALAPGAALCLAWRAEGHRRLTLRAVWWMAALAASPLLAFQIHAGGAIGVGGFEALFALCAFLNVNQLDGAFRAAPRLPAA